MHNLTLKRGQSTCAATALHDDAIVSGGGCIPTVHSVHSDPRPPYALVVFFCLDVVVFYRSENTLPRATHDHTCTHSRRMCTCMQFTCARARARVHIIKCNLSPCIVFNYVELHAYFKIILRRQVSGYVYKYMRIEIVYAI